MKIFLSVSCLIILFIIGFRSLYSTGTNFKSSPPVREAYFPEVPEKEVHHIAPLGEIKNSTRFQPVFREIIDSHHSIDYDSAWDDELSHLLVQIDPENGERIFKEYKEEKLKHEYDIQLNLNLNLSALASLNGESSEWSDEPVRSPDDLKMLEKMHQERITNILGDHLEAINNQYELYRQLNYEER